VGPKGRQGVQDSVQVIGQSPAIYHLIIRIDQAIVTIVSVEVHGGV